MEKMLAEIIDLIRKQLPGLKEILLEAGDGMGFWVAMKDGRRFRVMVFEDLL